MVLWDRGATLAERFRAHAGDETHLYAVAMRAMADDWEAGGPVRDVCAGQEDAPEGAALQLRLLAGIFRLVLDGRAPELMPWYACLGGDRPAPTVWPVMRAVVAAHVPELREALLVAPQTNEVGRAAALLVGLTDLAARTGCHRLRVLELGASAGLNLLLDRFRLTGPGWAWGPADSPVVLGAAVEGAFTSTPLTLVGAAGCDLEPVDPTTEAGRRLLTSFVWPFDLDRHARLAGALEVARRHAVRVDRAGAATWLARRLGETGAAAVARDEAGVLTVVWHSITQLYWSPDEVAAVDAVVASHAGHARVGRVSLEYEDAAGAGGEPVLVSTLWDPQLPGGAERRRLGTAHHHGIPVRLEVPVGRLPGPPVSP